MKYQKYDIAIFEMSSGRTEEELTYLKPLSYLYSCVLIEKIDDDGTPLNGNGEPINKNVCAIYRLNNPVITNIKRWEIGRFFVSTNEKIVDDRVFCK